MKIVAIFLCCSWSIERDALCVPNLSEPNAWAYYVSWLLNKLSDSNILNVTWSLNDFDSLILWEFHIINQISLGHFKGSNQLHKLPLPYTWNVSSLSDCNVDVRRELPSELCTLLLSESEFSLLFQPSISRCTNESKTIERKVIGIELELCQTKIQENIRNSLTCHHSWIFSRILMAIIVCHTLTWVQKRNIFFMWEYISGICWAIFHQTARPIF